MVNKQFSIRKQIVYGSYTKGKQILRRVVGAYSGGSESANTMRM